MTNLKKHPRTSEFESLLSHFSERILQTAGKCEEELTALQTELAAARNAALPAICALVALIEARDAYTYGHSRRIARMAVTFAASLNWPEEKIQLMNMVGLLHDIGKIIIPDSILNKEGKFTPLEYETMKLHSGTGGRIIQRLEFLGRDAELWVIHHHERYDGEGYPDGLKGEEIPVGARMLALVDAYDAMTQSRRYREKLPHWMALDEIVKCGGRQFDPGLAQSFLEAFKAPPDLSFSR